MQAFNRIGSVDDPSHLRGETVKGNNLFPVAVPALSDHRILFAPGAGFEFREPLEGHLGGFGPISTQIICPQSVTCVTSSADVDLPAPEC